MKKFTLLLSAMLMTLMSFGAVITFDADVDKGDAIVYTDGATGQEFTVTKDGVTLNVTSGLLGTYNSELHYRIYKNQSLKITSTVGAITSVQFTCTANGDAKYGPGNFTVSTGDYGHDGGAVGTWTGSATEITFSATTNQVRASQIVVAIDGEIIPGGGNGGGNDNDSTGTVPPAEGVITCAQAVEICKATGTTATTETYTIRGYVTEIKEAYTDQYKNVSCWMADEKGGGQVFLAFRVKPINAADQAVKVNDFIEVKGNLVNYMGNTPETTAGGSLTIITAGEEAEKPNLPEGLTGDGTKENPFTVEDVIVLNNQFPGPYYVKAFIVGQVVGASISTGAEFEAPFNPSTNTDGSVNTYNTNLLVASALDVTDVAKCVPVQLPAGDVRTNFNLPENPEMHGQEVIICGSLQKYFSAPGIKITTSIELVNGTNEMKIKGLQYADAIYGVENGIAFYDFDLYKDYDLDTEKYTYPRLRVIVKANSKTAINGTYDIQDLYYYTSEDNELAFNKDVAATLKVQKSEKDGYYWFTCEAFTIAEQVYSFNQELSIYASDEEGNEIILDETSSSVEDVVILDGIQKQMIDGHIFIMRDSKIFTILGTQVK